MNYSLNKVNKLLQDIATAHQQINSYAIGDIWEIVANGAVEYPLMFTVLNASSIQGNRLNLNISLLFMDLVDKAEKNELDVLSDQLQIATDVIAQLKDPIYEDMFIVGDSVNLEDFTERFNDEVSGYKVDITLIISELFDQCAIPIVGAPTSSLTCADAVVQNSNSSYIVSVHSGATLTLPNTSYDIYINGTFSETIQIITLGNQAITLRAS